jgi:hypothetical protein
MTAASSSSGFVPKTDSNSSSASSYLAFLRPIFRKIVYIVLPYSALDKFQSQKQYCGCSTFWFGHISPNIQILWIKHTVHCFTFELHSDTTFNVHRSLSCMPKLFWSTKSYSNRLIQRQIFNAMSISTTINQTWLN